MFSRKHLLASAILAAAGLISLTQASFAQSPSQEAAYVEDELLVIPEDGVSDATLEKIYSGHRGKLVKKLEKVNAHRIKVPADRLTDIEAALKSNPNIRAVEKNYLGYGQLIPNDPGFLSQWHLPNIWALSGWNITTGSSSISIAVIDSGVDPKHPDLVANLIKGYNFLLNNTDTHDVHGHGTAVAGTAAAMGNSGIGVAGVSWKNKIMPLVVLNSAKIATMADVSEAIIYAADHGAKVINISLSFNASTTTMTNAVAYAWNKGRVIVAAAGNYSTSVPYYPAALPNVIAVAATDRNNKRLSFSNFGTWIDVGAPGIDIYTTRNGGSYWWCYGTSLATPQVAALAALVFSAKPGLTNAQVVNLIKKNASDLGVKGFDTLYGWGRINVYRTLTAALTTPILSATISSPSMSTSVSGTVTVEASVDSEIGVDRTEFYVDGILQGTETAEPFIFAWNTTGLSGTKSLTIKTYDVAGHVAVSSPVRVRVTPSDTHHTP